MSIWFVIPSIRPNGGTIPLWRKMGYKVAVLRQGEPIDCEIQIPTPVYLGWAKSVNLLARFVVNHDENAEWIVTGGDDYEPDMNNSPEEIAEECSAFFSAPFVLGHPPACPTFGVMQPTGDRWGDSEISRRQFGENRGAMLDRIAGSPWMGREWVKRAYGGNGPMWPYWHCWADEELQCVAEKLGVYWQRRDLIQLHDHWARTENHAPPKVPMPDFWGPINDDYAKSRALFNERKAAGWPGHEPLLTSVSA